MFARLFYFGYNPNKSGQSKKTFKYFDLKAIEGLIFIIADVVVVVMCVDNKTVIILIKSTKFMQI